MVDAGAKSNESFQWLALSPDEDLESWKQPSLKTVTKITRLTLSFTMSEHGAIGQPRLANRSNEERHNWPLRLTQGHGHQ